MPTLTIPEEHASGLAKIMELSSDDSDHAATALRKAQSIELGELTVLVSAVLPSLAITDVREIVATLLSLYAAIPLLLEALRDKPAHWFEALRATANVETPLAVFRPVVSCDGPNQFPHWLVGRICFGDERPRCEINPQGCPPRKT